jgi:hypothetical protein
VPGTAVNHRASSWPDAGSNTSGTSANDAPASSAAFTTADRCGWTGMPRELSSISGGTGPTSRTNPVTHAASPVSALNLIRGVVVARASSSHGAATSRVDRSTATAEARSTDADQADTT